MAGMGVIARPRYGQPTPTALVGEVTVEAEVKALLQTAV
jgi:hypothetical protein